MKVWNGIERVPGGRPAVVASIGNYDGVHLGHREILRRVTERARALALPSLLLTFEPHPLSVVTPERKPALIQSRRQKLAALEQTGLDQLWIVRFDARVAALDGRAFFDEIVEPHLRLGALYVGRQFRFGYQRTGDLELLESIGRARRFEVVGVPPVQLAGETISSSAIRTTVEAGGVERAWSMLGRPFALGGEVIAGEGRGARLRFPTANLAVENELIPRQGVYVTETVALASRHASVTNVGINPTFGGRELKIETHLLEFEGDLLGERIEVRFLARIRDEMRFASALELGDQIARDCAAALAYFQNMQLETR